jgi:hypothetical protein
MRSLLLCVSLLFVSGFLHAIIFSTTTGGTWTDPDTWVGGVVPGNTDDVISAPRFR